MQLDQHCKWNDSIPHIHTEQLESCAGWLLANCTTEDGGFFVAGALLFLFSLAVAAFLCSLISGFFLCVMHVAPIPALLLFCSFLLFFLLNKHQSSPFFTLFSFPLLFFLFFASSRFCAPCKIFLLLLIELGLQLCAFCLSWRAHATISQNNLK